MNPRLLAAFMLLMVGGLTFVLDIVSDGGDALHLSLAAGLMVVGAVFTDPKELAPAARTVINGTAGLLPWNRKKRDSSSVPVQRDPSDVPPQE